MHAQQLSRPLKTAVAVYAAAAAAVQVCGGGMATIGDMVTERMAIAIDKGIIISGNKAEKGKTWCDILAAEDEDTGATVLDNFKSIWFTESSDN